MEFDLVLKNGIILDGSGAPPIKADIGIKDDTIIKIGDLSNYRAEKVIDVKGLYVAPGFIDIHNHSDISIFIVPTANNYVLQGVTTIVIGNCGSSPAPLTELNKELIEEWKKYYPEVSVTWKSFREYMKALKELEKSINVVPLVGFGTIRSAILGFENRSPTSRELEDMKNLAREALKTGAFGISTGLIYIPQVFASTEEIINVAKAVAEYGGIYASHIRNEGVHLVDAILEAITIGIKSGCSVEISHLKAAGIPAWGLTEKALGIISYYISQGIDVSADAYPYTATSTGLDAILPAWVREGGRKKLVEKLKDPSIVDKIKLELEKKGLMEERYVEWHQITIAYSINHKEVEGKTIDLISKEWGLDPFEVVIKLLIDDEAATAAVYHVLNEEDVKRVLKHPFVAIGSDGSIRKFGEGKPHPRNYGTFPRFIARYVRELKLISLPEAIRKITSLPARKLGLWDRGLIRPGMKADIVVFNYYTIRDTATFEKPHSYPTGIEYVIVNGVPVVEEGKHTNAKPGKVLEKAAS